MRIDLDKTTGLLTTDAKVVRTDDMDFGSEFEPTIGFDAFPNGLIFIQKKPNEGKKKFKLSFRGFGYNQSLSQLIDETESWRIALKEYMDHLKIKYDSVDSVLNNIPVSQNYMAVLNPASSVLYNPFMIIVFEAEHRIYYCFTREKIVNRGVSLRVVSLIVLTISLQCYTGRHPVRQLIDCSNEA